MRDPPVIAYLSGAYARASDSFIRGEVAQLRNLGYMVHTFAVRPPSQSEIVSEDIRRERDRTEYLLVRKNVPGLAAAALRTLIRAPRTFWPAVALALRCSNPGLKSRIWALAYVIEACFLQERLRAKAVGHLHNHIAEGSAVVAMLAAKFVGIPFSLTIHGPGEFDRAASLSLDQKVARAAFVAAVSEYGRSQVLRWSRVENWEKVKVVRCGVGDGFLAHPPTPIPDDPQLVFVGRLVHDKGLLPLLDAIHKLVEEHLRFRFVIVGDGPLRADIERMVERYALRDHVVMRGWMSGEAVRDEILRSRAFVLPSFAENLPVAIMEALALSRPVISTYLGGIPELVRDGVCGWLTPAGSVADLTSAMREALTAPRERLEEMGRAGAALVAERHNPKVEAGRLAQLITMAHHGTLPKSEPSTNMPA